MVNKIIKSYLSLIERHGGKTTLITFLTICVLSLGLSQFSTKNDVRIWFEETDPKLDTLNYLEKTFGNDETLVIAVELKEGVNGDLFHPEHMRTIQAITEAAWQIPQVIRVESLANYNYVTSENDEIIVEPFIGDRLQETFLQKRKLIASNDPAIKGYLIDEKAKLALIFAHLVSSNVQTLKYKDINLEARKILESQSSKNLNFYLTGKAALNYGFEEVSMGDVQKILPLLLLLIVAYLFYIFRSFKAMVLPFVIVFTTVTATLGLGFWLGIHFSAILAILPIILVAIGIADSVHVMVNFFQFRGKGQDKILAIENTVKKNFIPTFLTSFSTGIGLFSLMATKLVPIRHLGLLAGLGCMLAWFFTIFFLIPLLLKIDYKIPPIFSERSENQESSNLSLSFYKIIYKNRHPIVFVTIALAIGGLYLAQDIRTNADPDSYFSEEASISIANEAVKRHVGGSAGPDLIIDAGGVDKAKDPQFLKKVSEFNQWLRSLEPVNNTVSVLDIIKKMNQVLHNNDESFYQIPNTQNEVAQYLFLYTLSVPPGMDINNRISLDYSALRISLLWTVYDTQTWAIYRDKIKAKAEELGLDLKIAGKANLFQDMIDYVVETFVRSIFMAMLFVALCLSLFFGSIKIGLISLIPNLLPLTFGAATMALFGMDLNLGTSLVASVCLGIAVDDTIHFLSNYYKHNDLGWSTEKNITTIFEYTGSALIITTLILSSAFGLYILGDFLPNVNFGILCAVTLMAALIVDLIFLPAFIIMIGGKKGKEEGHNTASPVTH